MEFDFNTLYERLLRYWNKYDGLDFTLESLREEFKSDELACILFNDSFTDMNHSLIDKFKYKVLKVKNLFSFEDAERLYLSYPEKEILLEWCSDEYLLSLINNGDFNLSQYAISNIKSDEALMEVFKNTKDSYLKSYALSCVSDVNLKRKYLNRLPMSERYRVIVTFDDETIEKYISLFSANKADIIYALNDEKKDYYFRKYFSLIPKEEKGRIIQSFEDEEKILYYLRFVGDYVKGEVLTWHFSGRMDIISKVLPTIKNKTVIADVLRNGCVDSETIEKYIVKLTNQEDIEDIIFNQSNEDLLVKYFNKLSYKRKLERIKDTYYPEHKFKLLRYIDKPKDIISIIEHTESFPEYSLEYEYLIDLYSNIYKVDKNRLLTLINNTSMMVLKYMQSENIIKLLNSNDDEFTLLMSIFDKKDLTMNQSCMNDILNTMLQREFRISSPNIVLIFPFTLNAIDSKDRETVIKTIEILSSTVKLEEEINTYGWNKDSFVDALMNKDEKAIEFLHVLTAKYIRTERSTYIQEHLNRALESCTRTYCDKNELIRFVINNFPIEVILSYFSIDAEAVTNGEYTTLEFNLASNKDLLTKIIKYKKNPSSFEKMPDDVKANLRYFNSILDKRFNKVNSYSFPIFKGKKNVEFREVDNDFLVSILMNVDIDKLRVNFFNNPLLIDKFMKFWKQYKIGGWGNTFNNLLTSAGVVVDPEIVANFIQYFGLSYEQLEEKKDKKEISSISLTALLDLAACYSSESKKYSLLFGDEDFKYIASNPGPNSSTMTKEKRIDKAVRLVHTIRNRDYVTVPPVDKDFELPNGKKMNVVVGNFSNMMNLTYGERTGACMRIGGAGESLFNFCLEDECGFHIRFVNPKSGKFVSRVSGFRNGNTVFLNELRYSEDSDFTNKDVVEACKAVAKELIELSKGSELPIDNVVVTPYYAMKDSGMLSRSLGISDPQKGMKKFYTDVSTSSVVLATSGTNNSFIQPKLGVRGLPRYEVLRDKKKTLYNKDAYNYVAHIQMLDQVLGGESVETANVSINEDIIVCLAGEDWYVSIDNKGQIDKYIMNNSNSKDKAIDEVQEALLYIKDNLAKEMNIANNVLGM